ncbi:MAG: hypothetical protein HY711_01005 [Candidatus Melainabacteria bacterium]|nr:hypothetical protein [Candidatus Melainabacteria bacterium]
MKKAKLLTGLLLFTSLLLLNAGGALASGVTPEVRVTTGSYRIVGWEKELIKGDPTLAHWHWSAMTGFTQGARRISTVPARRVGQKLYVKPVHVPTISPQQQTVKTEVRPVVISQDCHGSLGSIKGALKASIPSEQVAVYGNLSGAKPQQDQVVDLQVWGAIAKYGKLPATSLQK